MYSVQDLTLQVDASSEISVVQARDNLVFFLTLLCFPPVSSFLCCISLLLSVALFRFFSWLAICFSVHPVVSVMPRLPQVSGASR